MACVPEVKICRTRGDTFPFDIFLKDAAGVAIDVTGSTFLLSVNTLSDPPDISTQLFQLVGAIVAPGTNGQVRFTPTTPDANQTPGTYFYDIQWTAGSSIRTILRGEWEVEQDITK